MKSFSAPGGRAYVSVRASNPDPSRRYHLTASDNFMIGAGGLRELAQFLIAFADEMEPPPPAKEPQRPAKKKPAAKGNTDEH